MMSIYSWARTIAKSIAPATSVAICSIQRANAEVLDKVPGVADWLFGCTVLVAIAYVLGRWRRAAVFAVYPLSLICSLALTELMWGDLGAAVAAEGGWPYVVTAYATVALAFIAPAAMYALFGKSKTTS